MFDISWQQHVHKINGRNAAEFAFVQSSSESYTGRSWIKDWSDNMRHFMLKRNSDPSWSHQGRQLHYSWPHFSDKVLTIVPSSDRDNMRSLTLFSLAAIVSTAVACDSCYGPSSEVVHERLVRRMQPEASDSTVDPKAPLEWGQLNFLHTVS